MCVQSQMPNHVQRRKATSGAARIWQLLLISVCWSPWEKWHCLTLVARSGIVILPKGFGSEASRVSKKRSCFLFPQHLPWPSGDFSGGLTAVQGAGWLQLQGRACTSSPPSRWAWHPSPARHQYLVFLQCPLRCTDPRVQHLRCALTLHWREIQVLSLGIPIHWSFPSQRGLWKSCALSTAPPPCMPSCSTVKLKTGLCQAGGSAWNMSNSSGQKYGYRDRGSDKLCDYYLILRAFAAVVQPCIWYIFRH